MKASLQLARREVTAKASCKLVFTIGAVVAAVRLYNCTSFLNLVA
jgi:hypothetical protein